MKLTGCTDIGRRYESNQDCFKAGRLRDDTYWMILCDGMGGVAAGGEASEIAVNFLEERLTEGLPETADTERIKELLLNSIRDCNSEIYKASRDENDAITMGTTAVVAVIRAGLAQIAHSGDSRAYVIGKRTIKQITKDHSMVQELLDSGRITEEEALHHPNKNIITSALGVDSEIRTDYNELKLRSGDILLICSDGLSNMVPDDEIVDIVRENDFYSTAEKLRDRALESGGLDNITAVLLEA